MSRRAKIVCTLGPSSESYEQIIGLIGAGMDVARFNLSHGSHEEHLVRYKNVRKASDNTGHAVAVLVDLQGPKIRLGKFPEPVELVEGQYFTITIEDVEGTNERCSTTYKGLPGDCHPGDQVLVDDGKVRLEVMRASATDVVTKVIVPGKVSSNKGFNLPSAAVSVPAMSEKDIDDLRWGLRTGCDLVALSFVRGPEDAELVRSIMAEEGRTVPVIAKLEKPQAVARLQEIVAAFDGIMVARGDLGVEMPLEEVPLVQKRAVQLCREAAKPVIVATQMLESMTTSPMPTRAEASDVANAILDGADAVMLSGETSVGEYAETAVRTMARIIAHVEENGLERMPKLPARPNTVGGAVTWAATEVSSMVDIKAICVFTERGDSARRMSRQRARVPLLAFTPNPQTRSQLALSWGVETFVVPSVQHTDVMVFQVDLALGNLHRFKAGDKVLIVAGSPPGKAGTTNALRIHHLGGQD